MLVSFFNYTRNRIELHFRHRVGSRVQLQETVSAGTVSHGVSCLSSLCWTIILTVWWSDSNKTEQNWGVPV